MGQSIGNRQALEGALPDAPVPEAALAFSSVRPMTGFVLQTATSSQSLKPSPPLQPGGNTATSASQTVPVEDSQQETPYEKARKQLKDEEKQRVLGVVPNFGTTYLWDAAHLTAGQKMNLALRSAIDPFTFAAAVLVAGGHEVMNDEPGFQWGAAGFGQRAGAAYLDAFDGNMLGTGILPALLRQDPRYFRMGRGSFHRRLIYSIEATVVCRGDNGHNQFNYSNVGGNLAAGAISNLYYPSQNAGLGQTIGNALIVTAENTAGGIFDEFWPDISRKIFHRDPTNGLDDRDAAADRLRKQAPAATQVR